MGTGLRSAIWTQSHITELLSSGGEGKRYVSVLRGCIRGRAERGGWGSG